MTLIELTLQQGNDGLAILNSANVEGLDIADGSLIKICDEEQPGWTVLKAYISEESPTDMLIGDSNILEQMGFYESSIIEIEPYHGKIYDAEDVLIEFSSLDRDPKEMFYPENREKMRNFIQKYHFTELTELYWPEQNSTLRIQINSPEINEGIFRIPDEITLKLRQKVQTMPFNAILLIDKSKSMSRKDVLLEGTEGVLDELWRRFFGSSQYNLKNTPYKDLMKWLNLLSKNKLKRISYNLRSNTQEITENSASRLDSVLLSTILFFQLKISRGFGEKCSFILYSDHAKIIQFNNTNYIEATEFNADVCNQLIEKIKSRIIMPYGNTNISSSIAACKEVALEYKRLNGNPLMILLLTDGTPFPPDIDTPPDVITSIVELKRFLEREQIPFVVYTIGIGDQAQISSDLLERVAKIGNGEFLFFSNIVKLTSWYQKLAKDFTYTIHNA
ncbi:MAG: hypothetical protein ACTSVV_06670 [Promethearchaeota archaeon]